MREQHASLWRNRGLTKKPEVRPGTRGKKKRAIRKEKNGLSMVQTRRNPVSKARGEIPRGKV